jgi:hypothetical protein
MSSYTWSSATISNGVPFQLNTTTSYTVVGIDAATGCTNSTSITLAVAPKVIPTASTNPVCAGSPTTLSTNIGTYSTTFSGGAVDGVPISPTTTTTYTMTSTSYYGCTNTDSIQVVVNPLPTVTALMPSPDTICDGVSLPPLYATGAVWYYWSSGIIAPPSVSCYVVGTDANGCSNTDSTIVHIRPKPIVHITASADTICSDSLVVLTAGGDVASYAWSSGIIDGVPFNIPYSNSYTVTATDAFGCTNTNSKFIREENCYIPLNLTALIEGYYDVSSGQMRPVLDNQGVANPWWLYPTDSITVELHKDYPPYDVVSSYKTFIKIWGNSLGSFYGAFPDRNYYIVVKHRNSIETWSGLPVYMNSGSNYYSFTNAASKAYGSNQVEVSPGVWAMFSGDINQDGFIDNGDFSLWESDATSFASGYLPTDLNGDGLVDNGDYIFWEVNSNNFVGAMKP